VPSTVSDSDSIKQTLAHLVLDTEVLQNVYECRCQI
jgi:hypothetical protein